MLSKHGSTRSSRISFRPLLQSRRQQLLMDLRRSLQRRLRWQGSQRHLLREQSSQAPWPTFLEMWSLSPQLTSLARARARARVTPPALLRSPQSPSAPQKHRPQHKRRSPQKNRSGSFGSQPTGCLRMRFLPLASAACGQRVSGRFGLRPTGCRPMRSRMLAPQKRRSGR